MTESRESPQANHVALNLFERLTETQREEIGQVLENSPLANKGDVLEACLMGLAKREQTRGEILDGETLFSALKESLSRQVQSYTRAIVGRTLKLGGMLINLKKPLVTEIMNRHGIEDLAHATEIYEDLLQSIATIEYACAKRLRSSEASSIVSDLINHHPMNEWNPLLIANIQQIRETGGRDIH